MTRVAIYARYSSELQSEQSIEDQVALCRNRAANESWNIVETSQTMLFRAPPWSVRACAL